MPFFHAASRLDRPQLRTVGAGIAGGSILGYALIAMSPEDSTGSATGWTSNLAAVILLSVMVVATVLLVGLRREVYQLTVGAPRPGNQDAMASVEATRRKRDEARKLAVKDPMMARELGIGNPQLRQGYDDGGLLELNFATAEQLSVVCGLPPTMAEQVVTSRATLGRFLHVEDAIVYGQVGEEYAPLIRDRGIVIADR
ncbi:helix-hairpin-helix domain-containing protein [Nocardioides houyundeii]|uniref:helix-hairpin-helix domain-containing protein n=1 Tax=Nocardioides houyundeii TaxID=2045452 RepID=UPI0018F04D59|nr:helix-hairpin-helix domain-containing protein [Nocardioides houyundeii]